MNPSEFLDVLERLRARLQARARRANPALGKPEQVNVQSVVGAWFREYQPYFAQVVGVDDPQIGAMDEIMQELLQISSDGSARRTVTRSVSRAAANFRDNLLVRISRAYWSSAPQRSPVGRDEDAARRLRNLDPKVADSYEQGVLDIEASDRLSYRGPAAEVREVLTVVLHTLAPNSEVMSTDWYKEARRSGTRTESTPTRAERTKFILRRQASGSVATETAESYMSMVEERLGHVIGRTFERSSAATHAGAERDELIKLLPYINALLRELLPSTGAKSS